LKFFGVPNRVTILNNKDAHNETHVLQAALAFMLTPIAAQIPPAQKPSFTVVSIKSNKSGNRIVMQLTVEQSQEYGRGGATGHVLSEGVTGCLSYWVV